MFRPLLCLALLVCSGIAAAQDGNMNNARLDSLLRGVLESVEGEPGRWELQLADTPMFCLTDENHDRMRIIAPVKELAQATAQELADCLAANFHTALDVRYAIADDLIWVAFIHPLSPLTERQLYDALGQVRSAVVTFGTTYTSTDLVFPGAKRQEAKKKENIRRL